MTTQTSQSTTIQQPFILRIFAKIISYIFHPLFIPTYFFIYLMQLFPYEFAGITVWQLKMRLFGVFWLTVFFPAFAVFLLWRLKFSESIFLRTQKERIIPYIITMFFYWWMYYLSRNFLDQPIVLKFFFMGIFMATAVGLILNNYFKISMHSMGMGGIAAALIFTSYYYEAGDGISISIILFITGLVCTARLLVSDHSIKEIYTGLLVGVFCQIIAYLVVM